MRMPIAMLALVCCAACGANNGGPGGNVVRDRNAFVGIWETSGTLAIAPASLSLQGTEVIQADTTFDNQLDLSSKGCNLPAVVSGNIATIPSGSSCTVTQSGETVSLTFQSGSLVLNPDDSITMDGSGTATVTPPGSTGSFVWTSTLTPQPP